MQMTKGHGEETASNMFRHCTNGSATVAINRGDLVKFDMTDNRAVTGINRSTFGMRVIATVTSDLTGNIAIPLVAGVAEQEGVVTVANQTRNDGFLVQVSGYHDFVKVSGNVVVSQAVGLGDVAASAADQGASGSASAEDVLTLVGISCVTATTPGNTPCILRGLL